MKETVHTIDQPVLVLVGPTAIGKTALSLAIAKRYSCEIISLDSMQVYRYMDIGTAKASKEERAAIPHHLIDIVDPDEEYNAQRYADDALKTIAEIHCRGKIPLLTGGTGLYLRSLTEGFFSDIGDFPEIRASLHERVKRGELANLHQELQNIDPESGARIHANDTSRIIRGLEIFLGTGKTWTQCITEQKQAKPSHSFAKILELGLTTERKKLYADINRRTGQMIEQGLEEEVKRLLAMGYPAHLKSMQSIGYRHMLTFLSGQWKRGEMEEFLARDTRRYAKRQYTWFNKMPIQWFQREDHASLYSALDTFLQG